MKITLKSLRTLNPCKEGYEWCHKNFKACKNDLATVLRYLQNDNHNDWANWLIVRHMTHEQKIIYAIFAAEQVLDIFEKQHPTDDRPRKAIETAKTYLKEKTIAYAADAAAACAADAYAAADAAAADAAYAADAYAAAYAADAASAAADAAYAYAADAASAAADAAYAYAAYAYAAAADAAYDDDAKLKMQKRILEYGISLIEKE